VEFHDKLNIDALLEFVGSGQAGDLGSQSVVDAADPVRNAAHASVLESAGCELTAAGAFADGDFITGLNLEAGDIDLAAVNANVTMVDELTSLTACLGKANIIDDAVHAGRKQL